MEIGRPRGWADKKSSRIDSEGKSFGRLWMASDTSSRRETWTCSALTGMRYAFIAMPPLWLRSNARKADEGDAIACDDSKLGSGRCGSMKADKKW